MANPSAPDPFDDLRSYASDLVDAAPPLDPSSLHLMDGRPVPKRPHHFTVPAMALMGGYLIAALGYRGFFLTGAGLTVAGALLFWASFGLARRGLVRATVADQVD